MQNKIRIGLTVSLLVGIVALSTGADWQKLKSQRRERLKNRMKRPKSRMDIPIGYKAAWEKTIPPIVAVLFMNGERRE